MNASDVIVSVRELTKVHAANTPREVRALDGLSFDVARGSYVAIIGESGSGKTTLMHVLGALDRASSGDVVVEQTSLASASNRALQAFRSKRIGFVFQGFNLIANLDALENVALAAHYAGRSARDATRAAKANLEALGLGDRLYHRPGELSGGQQQRVAIARALINEPAVLLADEPTGELDSRTAASILDTIESVRRERGQTTIVVTHSQGVWERAQRIITLTDGKIVADETR